MIHLPRKCIAGAEINLAISRAGQSGITKEFEEHRERVEGKMNFKFFSPAAFLKYNTYFYGSGCRAGVKRQKRREAC